jgi:hypothetical protein
MTHPFLLLFGSLLVITLTAFLYNLYQGFVDFSRRFRGVE